MLAEVGFSRLDVHNLAYADDFCFFASSIRQELLEYPNWFEMSQDSTQGRNMYVPGKQNGITTGHLGNSKYAVLPHCGRFSSFLYEHRTDLCKLVDVAPVEDMQVEMNAMAYGQGAWLSPHTDHRSTESDQRLVAWMLYLTDPSDNEWTQDQGGALRVSSPPDRSALLRPKFNRFALFKVSRNSLHEIETVTWNCGWERCRLALSGWLTGSVSSKACGTSVYLQSPDYLKAREQVETNLKGSLALYQLMYQQRGYCGLDREAVTVKLSDIEREYQSHLASPSGTSFLHLTRGPESCIVVLSADGSIVYFGPRADYSLK